MKASNKSYKYKESRNRIKNILDKEYDCTDEQEIPNKENAGLQKGYYVDAYCVSIDLRDSTKMLEEHNRKTNAKILRSYISEVLSVMNSIPECRYLAIKGDGVVGVYDCRNKSDKQNIEQIPETLNSLIKLLNKEYKDKGYNTEIKAGIGADFSKMLMITAGYRNSGLRDFLWIGEGINNAVHISGIMNKEITDPIGITEKLYNDLTEEQKEKYVKCQNSSLGTIYHKNSYNNEMNKWIDDGCQ